ncbi:TIGR03943 family protein, partial [Bacillus cereus]
NEKEGKKVKFDEREVSVDSEETSNLATTYKTEEQVVKSMLGQRKLQVKDKDYVQTMNVIGQNVNWFKGKEIT